MLLKCLGPLHPDEDQEVQDQMELIKLSVITPSWPRRNWVFAYERLDNDAEEKQEVEKSQIANPIKMSFSISGQEVTSYVKAVRHTNLKLSFRMNKFQSSFLE